MNLAQSYLKVQYELRSAKQVERRMLIDALQTLSASGFDISQYQYTGFGSVYFVDFVLFHKYLGISHMWTVEHDLDIRKRVHFNRPFNFVKVFMSDAGEVLARLPLNRKHLLWLDYDSFVSSDLADHIYLSISRLPAGSIVLVTVDVEPPVKDAGPKKWKQHFLAEVERYLPPKPNFGTSNLPRLNVDILTKIFDSAVAPRDGISFQPLFSFLYKDGHQMLTIGGMLVTPNESGRLRKLANAGAESQTKNMRFSWESDPCKIVVPHLTRKERIYLEGSMPAGEGWVPRNFELSREDVKAYQEIYRFYPVYAELFL